MLQENECINTNIIKKLKQVLLQDDCILFIGSGISVWSGLPTWAGLIQELEDFLEINGKNSSLIHAESQRGDLLQAASYGFAKLSKQQISEFIRLACRYGKAIPHEVHKKIVNLGPRCYITTNYDNLIEESIKIWRPELSIPSPVTNRHLIEMAQIITARAIDFIYKPHGDASDIDSIILTREQYRKLLEQGERHAALESLKTLMISRPIIYLGFGLRDPDFLYLKDLLANTYSGGTRSHYAIMPDVTEEETNYWQTQYGIQIISYKTIIHLDNSKDHSLLLKLLDDINETQLSHPTGFSPYCSDTILALARHAANLSKTEKIEPEFEINVQRNDQKRNNRILYIKRDDYDNYPVDKFLDDGPHHAILLGMPGAGKSYSLHQSAARLARILNNECLSDNINQNSNLIIPILVDLKIYSGNIIKQINDSLSKSLPIEDLKNNYHLKIYIDSFNEMPKEYLENGLYKADFEMFIKSFYNETIIICSRFSDGLESFGFPIYRLEAISESNITRYLDSNGYHLTGLFKEEMLQLLKQPFYLHYLLKEKIHIQNVLHPKDFFDAFFSNIVLKYKSRFSNDIDILRVLTKVAYNSLEIGEEAFLLSELLDTIKLCKPQTTNSETLEIANWLVSISVILPYPAGRVAFIHQSLTEYLAAKELAFIFLENEDCLIAKLQYNRWDQPVLVALSILPADKGKIFLEKIIMIDYTLALKATRYLENDQSEQERIISRLLAELVNGNFEPFDYEISSILRNLPYTDSHVPQLRSIIELKHWIGGAAIKCLVNLKGQCIKAELLGQLVDNSDDSSFCSSIGESLSEYAILDDVKLIIKMAEEIQNLNQYNKDIDSIYGFIHGSALFMQNIDLELVIKELLSDGDLKDIKGVKQKLLFGVLGVHHSTYALSIACELLNMGYKDSITTIYSICEISGRKIADKVSWDVFRKEHIDVIMSFIPDALYFISSVLKIISSVRPDLCQYLLQKTNEKKGIEKAYLFNCIYPDNTAYVFSAFEEIANMNQKERSIQMVDLIAQIQIDWKGNSLLFVKLLRLHDIRLASNLMGHIIPFSIKNLGNLDIGPIDWWLDWMLEIKSNKKIDFEWYIAQFAFLFGNYLDPNKQNEFVDEFNKANSKYRKILLDYFLPCIDLTVDKFSDEALEYIIIDLKKSYKSKHSFGGKLLNNIATEQFINTHLMPLLPNAGSILKRNLVNIINDVSNRHGKRYITEIK
jgi:hypothetical protein